MSADDKREEAEFPDRIIVYKKPDGRLLVQSGSIPLRVKIAAAPHTTPQQRDEVKRERVAA